MERLNGLLQRLAPATTAALVLAMGYLGWEFLARGRGEEPVGRRAAPVAGIPPEFDRKELGIIQFYGAPAAIVEGETAVVCYGVAKAAAVRIEPDIGPVPSSLNRCLSIDPRRTTQYTLTATDAAGKTVSASFAMTVRPDPDRQPKILYFTKGRKQNDGGQTLYTLCFETRNATLVSVEPRAFRPAPLVRGCFYIAPGATTTYRLVATDDRGRRAERSLVAEVP